MARKKAVKVHKIKGYKQRRAIPQGKGFLSKALSSIGLGKKKKGGNLAAPYAGKRLKKGRGGFIGALASAVLPSIIAPLANRLFSKSGSTSGDGRKKKRASRKKKLVGGAVITPGPLA